MSEDTNTNESASDSKDNGVINELRQKARELERLRTEYDQARAEAAEQLLIDRGYPKMTDLFVGKVEGFPTAEKADEFLAGLGLTANQNQPPAAVEGDPEPDTSVTGLGQRLAAAASGATPTGPDAIQERLDKATSRAEIAQIMAEARASS